MASAQPTWAPSLILFQIKAHSSDSLVVEVETDSGRGFLKTLNEKGCPHDLACEFVGVRLARLIGLPTTEDHLIEVTEKTPIALWGGARVVPGPAFITRRLGGWEWSGRVAELEAAVNPSALGRLVAFDTWVLNCDRYRPARSSAETRLHKTKNVFLSTEGTPAHRVRITTLDHGCCFKCTKDLSPAFLDRQAADDTLYGLFPEFSGLARLEDALEAVAMIESLSRRQIEDIVSDVPRPWLSSDRSRAALVNLLVRRARGILRRVIETRFTAADLFERRPSAEEDR